MSRVIDKQRCFKVPKAKLSVFLSKLTDHETNILHMEAEFIFANGKHYDVVVNFYGSYPFVENQLREFAEEL